MSKARPFRNLVLCPKWLLVKSSFDTSSSLFILFHFVLSSFLDWPERRSRQLTQKCILGIGLRFNVKGSLLTVLLAAH